MFYTLFRLLSPFLPKLLHILRNHLRQWAHQSPLSKLLEAAEGMDVEPCLFHDVLIRDAVAYRRALSRLGNARMRFGIALAAPDLHGFITDGTRRRHLMTRADALQIAPLESPANRGTAIARLCRLLPKGRKNAGGYLSASFFVSLVSMLFTVKYSSLRVCIFSQISCFSSRYLRWKNFLSFWYC